MSLSVAALSAVLGGGGAGGELEGVHIPPGIILHQVPVSPSTLKQSGNGGLLLFRSDHASNL